MVCLSQRPMSPQPYAPFVFTLLLFFHFFDVPRPSMHSTLFYAFGPLCLCLSRHYHGFQKPGGFWVGYNGVWVWVTILKGRMFSRTNHHQRHQQSSPPHPIRESLRSHLRKTTQPSTRNDTAVKTLHPSPTDANHTQQKRVSHTKIEGEPTNRGTCQQPLSPPETPGPETLRPTTAHLQPAGLPTVAEDSCLFESLLESALAALVAVRSTPIPNPTSILSQTAKNTLAKLNKLVNAATPEASNDRMPNSP
jgi:hypothetical protein